MTKSLRKIIDSYRLSENDVRVLWKSFQRWDDDDNGTIEDKEFLAHIDERPSFFTLAIFRFIDENSDGIMSFSEFIHASMKFGLLSQNEILEFCFNIFLRGKGSTIEGFQLRELVETMHRTTEENKADYEHVGQKVYSTTLNATLAKVLDRISQQPYFGMAQFRKLNRDYPQLLFPCFRVQRKIQRQTLGQTWFERRHEENARALLEKGPTLKQRMDKFKQNLERTKERLIFCCCFGEKWGDPQVDIEDGTQTETKDEHSKRKRPDKDNDMDSIFWNRESKQRSVKVELPEPKRPRDKLCVEELSSAAVAELMRNRASQRAKEMMKKARIKAKRLENSRRNVKLETMTLYDD